VPLVCLPMLDGYRRNAGFVANIQLMSLPITPDKNEPDFREVASLDSERDIFRVEYGKMTLAFPNSMSNDEIEAAIRAEKRSFNEKDLAKFIRFYGWRVAYRGTRVPFKYIVSAGLLLVFGGSMVLISGVKQRRNQTTGG